MNRNKYMPFEPEKWDSSNYDLYMDWCGGVSYSGSDDIPNKFVDNIFSFSF